MRSKPSLASLSVLCVLGALAGSPLATAAPTSPAGRGYEMVSPVEKDGASVSRTAVVMSAESGDRVAYVSNGSFAGSLASLQAGMYLSYRAADDWSTQGIDPPQRNPHGFLSVATPAVSRDLSQALQASLLGAAPGAVDGSSNVFMRDSATGERSLIVTHPEFSLFQSFATVGSFPFKDATADFGHVLIGSDLALTPDATPGVYTLYEYVDGDLRIASRLPDGSIDPIGVTAATDAFPQSRAISDDGSRVFFKAASTGALYMRENGATTTLLSGSQRAGDDPAVPHAAYFGRVSADGSTVYFMSSDNLTDESDPRGYATLYRYEVDSGELTDLTVVSDPSAEMGAHVDRVLATSDDGSYVYFAAGGALTPDAVSVPMGQPYTNLYVWHDGQIDLIGTGDPQAAEPLGPGVWYASPNGEHLSFNSTSPVTGDHQPSPKCPADGSRGNPEGWCIGVYAYDAVAGELECVSCPPEGSEPIGDGSRVGGQEYGSSLSNYWPRAVLDDGTVFFDTPNRLVPEDVNGKIDAYRWKDGAVALVSTGKSDAESNFAEATPGGEDVFIRTTEQLVGQDVDRAYDLYDVRVGGGLARQNPPPQPAACEGDDCQGASPVGAAGGDPSSTRVLGARNVAEGAAARFSVSGLSKAQRTRLARTGRATVRVRTNRAGRVSIVVRARLGRRSVAVGRGSRSIARAGTASVTVRISKAARGRLAQGRKLRLALSVRFSKVPAPKQLTLTLTRPGR